MASVYDSIKDKNNVVRYRKDNRFCAKADVPAAAMEVLNLENIVDENGLVIVDQKNDDAKKVSPADEKASNTETPDNKPEEGADDDKETDDPDPAKDPGDEDKPSVPKPSAPEVSAEDDSDIDDPEETEKPGKKATPKPTRSRSSNTFKSKVPQSRPGMGFPRVNGKTVDIFDGKTPHTHIKLIGGHTVPLSTESFNTKTEKQIEDQLTEMGYDMIDFTRDESRDGLVEDRGESGDGLDGAGLTPDTV